MYKLRLGGENGTTHMADYTLPIRISNMPSRTFFSTFTFRKFPTRQTELKVVLMPKFNDILIVTVVPRSFRDDKLLRRF